MVEPEIPEEDRDQPLHKALLRVQAQQEVQDRQVVQGPQDRQVVEGPQVRQVVQVQQVLLEV